MADGIHNFICHVFQNVYLITSLCPLQQNDSRTKCRSESSSILLKSEIEFRSVARMAGYVWRRYAQNFERKLSDIDYELIAHLNFSMRGKNLKPGFEFC